MTTETTSPRTAIKIGNVTLDNNVILAPMSGVTDLPFRKLVKRSGAGLVVSEMIASQAMVRQNARTLKMSTNCAEEFPMAVQLAGCDPEVMAEAAQLNEARGAAIIDINFGCPVKKVVNGHAGSSLMRDEEHAAKILEATVKAVKIPVTLKMRTGWDDKNRNAPRLAKIAESVGIKMITIHGRTRCQFYRGVSDWSFIREVKNAVSLPVIANGDIVDFDSAKRALAESGADGIMIGRGAYGKPWFLKQVADYIHEGKVTADPSIKERYEMLCEHYEDMLDHYGDITGVRMARKHLSWYSKGLKGSAEFRAAMNQQADAKEVWKIIKNFYESTEIMSSDMINCDIKQ